jgi:hypothetical protein
MRNPLRSKGHAVYFTGHNCLLGIPLALNIGKIEERDVYDKPFQLPHVGRLS